MVDSSYILIRMAVKIVGVGGQQSCPPTPIINPPLEFRGSGREELVSAGIIIWEVGTRFISWGQGPGVLFRARAGDAGPVHDRVRVRAAHACAHASVSR